MGHVSDPGRLTYTHSPTPLTPLLLLPLQVQWDTRLEAQARIAELEQALRRAELDARDTVHRVELQADERRLDEARKFQLQVSELQNELRLERLRQGGAQPDDLAQDSLAQQLAALQVCGPASPPSHPTFAPTSDPIYSPLPQREHAALLHTRSDAEALMMDVEGGKEALERELNQTRDRLRAAQAASGDWLAEQNTQLRTITQLQAVQAELQRELKIKDQQLERARIGPGSAAATTPMTPQRSLFGFNFGGGGEPASPAAPATVELAEQLEARDAESAALKVQLANLKGVLQHQEQMLLMKRHEPSADVVGRVINR